MTGGAHSTRTSRLTRVISIALGLPWVEILAEAWVLGRKILRGMANEGMYEVLDYETVLEIHDPEGKKATIKKRQKVCYLQDYIIAYQDQAWGDGEILIDYKCSPGTPVDKYRLGHKTYVLISLRDVKHRGDIDDFNIEWGIRNGFLRNSEQWSTNIRRKIRKLRVVIIFPKDRPPLICSLLESNTQRKKELGKEARKKLPDGRWQITWEMDNPKLYETYLLTWNW